MNTQTSTLKTKKTFLSPTKAKKIEVFYPETDDSIMPENDLHFKIIANLVLILETFLRNQADVNIFGDLMLYYEKGNARKCVAPDVMVCFGIDKQPRKKYLLWEEKSVPSVIIEIASSSTWEKDLTTKFALYQNLGVKEYYIFDVERNCLLEPFLAFHRKQGELVPMEIKNGRILSKSLGLELVDTGETLRLFNPQTEKFLMTMEEMSARIAELENK